MLPVVLAAWHGGSGPALGSNYLGNCKCRAAVTDAASQLLLQTKKGNIWRSLCELAGFNRLDVQTGGRRGSHPALHSSGCRLSSAND